MTESPVRWVHAPSTAAQWIPCAGSVALQWGLPDSSGPAAADGTRLHTIAAECLGEWVKTRTAAGLVDLYKSAPDDYAIVEPYVTFVIETVKAYEDRGAKVLVRVEQVMRLDEVLGARADGTPDCLVIAEWPEGQVLLHIFDFKSGYDEVADDTPQLLIYLLAEYLTIATAVVVAGGATSVVQPRLRSNFKILDYTTAELDEAAPRILAAARRAWDLTANPVQALEHLVPGEKQCRWCKAAKAVICPAYNQLVHDTVFSEIVPIDDPAARPVDEVSWVGTPVEFHQRLLPLFMARVRLIEHWVEYVKAKVASELEQGHNVPGWKLVTGRAGARDWIDEAPVLTTLKANQVPRELVMKPAELRSPAQVEKALKSTHPGLYEHLQAFVKQTPGKPSVAPESDPRPRYAPAASEEVQSYDASDLC
jgi:Protein of unknown function (DUF2800)